MRWKPVLFASVFAALAGILVFSDYLHRRPAEVDQPANVSAARPRIALVMKTLTSPFFVEMEKGARRAEAELGVELLVKTATRETSIEQQIAIVDQLTRARVDAIVIAPGDSYRLIPALKKAQDEGIAVVNIDNKLDAELARKLFTAYPRIKLLYCANDMMALGAIHFLQEARIKSVKVAGHDALEEARQAMRSGWLAASVDQQAGRQGFMGIAYAARMLKGESLPAETMLDTRLVTAKSLAREGK